MSQRTEHRLDEIARWFYYHEKSIPAGHLEKRVEFYQKSMSCMMELMAMLVEDVRTAEGRAKSNRLWLPSSMEMNGDVTRFS